MKRFLSLLVLAAPAFPLVWGVSLGGGAAVPFADYYSFAAVAPTAEARFLACLTPNVNLTFACPYRFGHDAAAGLGAGDYFYQTVPALAGLDYRFDFLPYMPYVGAGVAAVFTRAAYPAYVRPKVGDAPPVGPPPAAETVRRERRDRRFGGFAEGGLEYYLTQALALDCRARVIYALGGAAAYYGERRVEGTNYMALDAFVGFCVYPFF